MNTQVTLTPSDALEGFAADLQRYQEVSRRSGQGVLLQKSAQLIFGNTNPKFGAVFPGLYSLFKGESPKDGAIWAAARARHFRVGRKILGPGKLSPRAISRAQEMMEGYKTIIVSTRPDGSALKFIRSGERKARVHFRFGRNSYAVSGDYNSQTFGGIRRRKGDKAINFRAVATFFELQLREQGRRFMGAAWLHRRWRKLAQSDPNREELGIWRELENVNPRATMRILGSLGVSGNRDSNQAEVRISSFVPGTKTLGEQRGLFTRAIEGVRSDIRAYLARKQREAFVDWLHHGPRARGL